MSISNDFRHIYIKKAMCSDKSVMYCVVESSSVGLNSNGLYKGLAHALRDFLIKTNS